MSEQVIQASADTVFSILGQKEVERLLLIQKVRQLEEEVKKLSQPTPEVPAIS